MRIVSNEAMPVCRFTIIPIDAHRLRLDRDHLRHPAPKSDRSIASSSVRSSAGATFVIHRNAGTLNPALTRAALDGALAIDASRQKKIQPDQANVVRLNHRDHTPDRRPPQAHISPLSEAPSTQTMLQLIATPAGLPMNAISSLFASIKPRRPPAKTGAYSARHTPTEK